MTDKPNHLLVLAQKRAKSLAFWATAIWWLYILGKLVAYGTGILVPFGLAALPHIPQPHHPLMNIVLLILSFISIATQGVLDSLRVRDRALTVRTVRSRLQIAIAQFEEGKMEVEELVKSIELAETEFLGRNVP